MPASCRTRYAHSLALHIREDPLTRTIEVRFPQASQLLTALLPFSGLLPPNSLFRGHGDSDSPLEPRAWRPEKAGASPTCDPVRDEILRLRLFLDSSDRQGLPIPHGLETVRRALRDHECPGPPERYWPSDEVIPALALAQHHGIPTCLLDWTTNPFTACYFAAAEFLRISERSAEVAERFGVEAVTVSSIAVWCFDQRAIQWRPEQNISLLPTVHVCFPPFAENDNLRAQEGAFMFSPVRCSSNARSLAKPFNQILAEHLDDIGRDTSPAFFKLVLGAGQAGDLLMYLEQMGLSATTLFPGYDGAARDVMLKQSLGYCEDEALFDGNSVADYSWLTDLRTTLAQIQFRSSRRGTAFSGSDSGS